MSKYLSCGLLFILLWSCNKATDTTPKSIVSLTQKDNNNEVSIEYIDAQWNYTTGKLTITAEGIDHELVKLHLPDISTAGLVNNLNIQNISYSDDAGFYADSCVNCSVTITAVNKSFVSGNFSATLKQQKERTETKSIAGSFTIYDN
jgi:hypothetical protein